MSLRFAILQTVLRRISKGDEKDEEEIIVLERSQDVLINRLRVNTLRNLQAIKKPFRGYSNGQIMTAAENAFRDIIQEFKDETIRIK